MAGRYVKISSFDAEQAGMEQPAPQIFQRVILPNPLCMKNGQQRFFVDKKSVGKKKFLRHLPLPKSHLTTRFIIFCKFPEDFSRAREIPRQKSQNNHFAGIFFLKMIRITRRLRAI